MAGIKQKKEVVGMTNCPNCAAPLKNGRCEYCGTQSESPQEIVGSFLEITADKIMIGAFVTNGNYRKITVNQS